MIPVKEAENLKGIYDMHVHAAPDVLPRKWNDFQLADMAVKAGAKGIVIKSHHGSTVERAYLCNLYCREKYGQTDFTMYGGIVLNRDVGGLNYKAVETAITMGAREVWFPTIDAKNDREKEGKPGGITITDDTGALKPEVIHILKLVKEANIVLSTGHLSPEEIKALFEAARNMGIWKLVVTHPEFWIMGLSHEAQKELVKDYGAYMERCCKQPLMDHTWKDNRPENLAAIQDVGWEHTTIATDSGQPVNAPWDASLLGSVQYLADHGISHEAIVHMTREVQSRLLDVKAREE